MDNTSCYFLIIYCSVCMEGKILAAYFFAQAQKRADFSALLNIN